MRKTNGVLATLILIALVIRVFHLSETSLSFDETFTALIAKMPLRSGVVFLVVDGVHPPLFYWIEHFFFLFGSTEFMLRLPAMIFGVLSVPAMYLMTKVWLGTKAASLAGLLLVFSPFHLWYSRDARMYTLLPLLAMVTMGLYTHLLEKGNRRIYAGFAFTSSLVYLTHYFALFLPFIQFVHLLLYLKRYYRKLRVWVGLQLLASLPLLGWIALLSRRDMQYFGIGWIPKPGLKDLLYTLLNFTVGYVPPVGFWEWLVVAFLAGLVLWGIRQLWSDRSIRDLLVLWILMPPLVIFLLSMRRPAYVDRFFIFSLPPLIILLAAGIVGLEKRWAAGITVLVILIFGLRASQILGGSPELRKEEWRQAADYLNETVAEDEVIVPRVLQIAVPLYYYLNEGLTVKAMEVNREVVPLQEIVKGYNGAWLVYWNASASAHCLGSQGMFDPAEERDPIASIWISGGGPEIIERRDFVGVTIFHYALDHN